jgi:hypothetical protein
MQRAKNHGLVIHKTLMGSFLYLRRIDYLWRTKGGGKYMLRKALI